MKYSINWLKELSETKWTTEELVENLTMRAFEVEREEFDIPESVIVGKILEIKKHPGADRLQIVKVDVGHDPSLLSSLPEGERESKNELLIVCGASNIQVGQKVPVALLGTVLPNGIEIKEAEIRGVRSRGMLCALDELGLGKDHSGIIILDEKAEIGQKFQKYLENNERTLEIKVLPDRAHDALSIAGMAREIGVLEGRKIDYDFDGLILPKKRSKELEVKIEDSELCSRYIGMVIRGIEVKESPEWLKDKLRDSGLRPINNVVDATNLIMLELGNPIHAFDLEKVKTGSELKIIVRKARKDEEITLLDGDEKKLDEDMLLIANPEGNLGLAGIKGGLNSGITEKTTDLVVEVANFNAVNIRKTRTKLGISTDASFRYEKDIDPNLSEKAAVRVLEIIQNIAGGELEGVVDNYPKKIESWKIDLSLGYAKNLLGVEVPETQIERTLELLGITSKKDSKKGIYHCNIPTIRLDLKTSEDLIEEIGRIWGYDNIGSQSIVSVIRPAGLSPLHKLGREARRIMSALGFSEVYNYSFYGEKERGIAGKKGHFEIENPVSPEEKYVRATLIPGLLKNTALNLGNFSDFGIFEIGKVYEKDGEERKENQMLGGILVRSKNDAVENFQEIKGLLQAFGEKLDVAISFEENGSSLGLISSGEKVGVLKLADKSVQETMSIKRFSGSLWVFEFDLEKILGARKDIRSFEELPRFPKSPRDISFMVPSDSKTTYGEIEAEIRKSTGELLESMELFDVFERDGKKSYAVHLDFMSKDRTLENEEVEKEMEKIIRTLEKLGFEIRK